jgi:hypothetical protein
MHSFSSFCGVLVDQFELRNFGRLSGGGESFYQGQVLLDLVSLGVPSLPVWCAEVTGGYTFNFS